jgi:hypothetical protein
MKLTQEQVTEMFHAITGPDPQFVRMFAKAALESMIETQADMYIDVITDPAAAKLNDHLRPPTVNDARDAACEHLLDVLKDFHDAVNYQIRALEATVRHTLSAHVSFSS